MMRISIVSAYFSAHTLRPNCRYNDCLSADLIDEQRYDKVGDLLRKMRKNEAVSFDRSSSRWHLA